MSNQKSGTEMKGVKRLRLIARILGGIIIAIGLTMLIMHIIFPEPTVEDYPPIENLLPVLMLLSALSLALAWRWELLGAILSLGFFILHMALFWAIRGEFFPLWALVNFSPLPLTGVLFLILGLRASRG